MKKTLLIIVLIIVSVVIMGLSQFSTVSNQVVGQNQLSALISSNSSQNPYIQEVQKLAPLFEQVSQLEPIDQAFFRSPEILKLRDMSVLLKPATNIGRTNPFLRLLREGQLEVNKQVSNNGTPGALKTPVSLNSNDQTSMTEEPDMVVEDLAAGTAIISPAAGSNPAQVEQNNTPANNKVANQESSSGGANTPTRSGRSRAEIEADIAAIKSVVCDPEDDGCKEELEGYLADLQAEF